MPRSPAPYAIGACSHIWGNNKDCYRYARKSLHTLIRYCFILFYTYYIIIKITSFYIGITLFFLCLCAPEGNYVIRVANGQLAREKQEVILTNVGDVAINTGVNRMSHKNTLVLNQRSD